MYRFYAQPENITPDKITLTEDETRHLRDVLRLRTGDIVGVFDGLGREYKCSIEAIEKRSSLVTIIDEIEPRSPESGFELTLAPALLKGEKFDLIVQKAVELGVTRVIPLKTVRCDVKLGDNAKRLDRWRRIALEATKQCGRASLMSVMEPATLESLIAKAVADEVMMFSEREGEEFTVSSELRAATAIFGPEGGWDDSEVELARENGVRIVTLAGRILRAETAVVAISAILQHRFGDLK